jgi:hypothetical protein
MPWRGGDKYAFGERWNLWKYGGRLMADQPSQTRNQRAHSLVIYPVGPSDRDFLVECLLAL